MCARALGIPARVRTSVTGTTFALVFAFKFSEEVAELSGMSAVRSA